MSMPSSLPSAITKDPLLDPEASAQSHRDNHRPPLPNPARALGHVDLLGCCLIV